MNTHPTRTIAARLAPVALCGVTLVVAACGGGGGDDSAATAATPAEFQRAALKFARCMRDHGVDMPDPKQGEGGFMITPDSDPSKSNPEQFRRAGDACQRYMRGVEPPPLSEDEQAEFRTKALKHARCMRAHGIDMPDPHVGEGGRIALELPDGIRPDDPRFARAADACRGSSPMPLPGG